MQPLASLLARKLVVRPFGSIGTAARRSPAARDDGFTAVEFALIIIPFVMMIFGILGVCLYFFTVFTVEHAVTAATREVRTGALQSKSGSYAGLASSAQLQDKLRDEICRRSPGYIKSSCASRVRVLVQSGTGYGGLTEPVCTDGSNNLISASSAAAAFNPGASSSVVYATACVSYTLWKMIPYFPVPNGLADGTSLIQASATFRTEPY